MTELARRVLAHPSNNPALVMNGRAFTFGEIQERALAFASTFVQLDAGPLSLVAIVAEKELDTYAAILGAHLAGLGYVPLNPKQPAARSALMLKASGSRILVPGGAATRSLLEIAEPGLQVVGRDASVLSTLVRDLPDHKTIQVFHDAQFRPVEVTETDLAYLLFTSGTTGQPKGVPISFGNLNSYVTSASALVELVPEDRCSQTFNLNFDLSAHDVFVTWAAGACLFPMNATDLLAPARFLRAHELTTWFSVPAVAMTMQRTRTLRPGVFPSLRNSLFCGEALPLATAEAWAEAAPNSRLLNLYGPTEATIAITSYEWQRDQVNLSRYGLVPIGRPIGKERTLLLDCEGNLVKGPGRGELALAGNQVAHGYLNAPDLTAAAFAPVPGVSDARCYRTGDLVERDSDELLHYIGRLDSQVKLRGHRIELQEIDRALRAAARLDLAVAVALPPKGPVQEIVGVIADRGIDEQNVLEKCKALLPDAMVPSRIILLDDLPVNANGKIDRNGLAERLAET